MRKRRKSVILAVCAVLGLLLLIVIFRSEPEPAADGRPLSYWVKQGWYGGPEQEHALRSIGTNACPFLLRWLRTRELGGFFRHNKLFGWRKPPLPDAPFALLSAYAFQVLGDQAIPALPELSKLGASADSPGAADMALTALHYMGSNGAPALLAAARNPSHPFRNRAVEFLGEDKHLGPYADSVVAELVAELKDPDVNQTAALALGRLLLQPDLVVPALAHCLELTNERPNLRAIAAMSLGSYADKAQPILPYLTNALADPDPEVRRRAAESIQQIQRSH